MDPKTTHLKILNHRERDGYWSSIVLVSLVCLCDNVFSSKHHFTFRYVPFFLSLNDKTLSLSLSHIAIYQPKIQVTHPFMIKFTFLSLSMERKRTHLWNIIVTLHSWNPSLRSWDSRKPYTFEVCSPRTQKLKNKNPVWPSTVKMAVFYVWINGHYMLS